MIPANTSTFVKLYADENGFIIATKAHDREHPGETMGYARVTPTSISVRNWWDTIVVEPEHTAELTSRKEEVRCAINKLFAQRLIFGHALTARCDERTGTHRLDQSCPILMIRVLCDYDDITVKTYTREELIELGWLSAKYAKEHPEKDEE